MQQAYFYDLRVCSQRGKHRAAYQYKMKLYLLD